MKNRLFFRLDAGSSIGLGHLRRCATLAIECIALDLEPHFMVRLEPGFEIALDLPSGAVLHALPWDLDPVEDANRLAALCAQQGIHIGVIDHYRISESYQATLQSSGLQWMQFGNLAHHHPILGQLLHDATPGVESSQYQHRLRFPDTQLLLGPEYALLRRDFAQQRQSTPLPPGGPLDSVLLTFGGGDDRGATLRAFDWLAQADFGGHVLVLTTSLNPAVAEIKRRAQHDGRISVFIDEWNVAPIMASCQLAITAAGTSLHELACLGLPTLIVSLAENQRAPAAAWQRMGWGAWMGDLAELQDGDATRCLSEWIGDDSRRIDAAKRCFVAQDGLGAHRTAEAIRQIHFSPRPAC